jgi:hypothetical protein
MIGFLEFDSQRGLGIFLFTTAPRTSQGPNTPPIQWGQALSLGVKRPGREADHSPHLVPRSKNEWSYTSTPQYAFMAWCLVKHRDNFTFTCTFTSATRRSLVSFAAITLCVASQRVFVVVVVVVYFVINSVRKLFDTPSRSIIWFLCHFSRISSLERLGNLNHLGLRSNVHFVSTKRLQKKGSEDVQTVVCVMNTAE